jgi:hypothetical protein
MSTGLVPPPKKKTSGTSRSLRPKGRTNARRSLKLDLDPAEVALHAAISAAVAKDLGR